MNLALLLCGAVIIACIIANKLSTKMGVPSSHTLLQKDDAVVFSEVK